MRKPTPEDIFETGGKKKNKIRKALLQNVLFVDPGLGGTGWAFYPELSRKEFKKPKSWGALYIPQGLWEDRVDGYGACFYEATRSLDVNWLLIEIPNLWGGSAKSQASASGGNLTKLAYLAGALSQSVDAIPILFYPQQWKGQLPKKVTEKRLKRVWPKCPKGLVDHTYDALAMGLAAQIGL